MLPDKPKDKLRQMGTTDPIAEAKKVYNTKRQPGFHESNKSFLEKLACCCVVDTGLKPKATAFAARVLDLFKRIIHWVPVQVVFDTRFLMAVRACLFAAPRPRTRVLSSLRHLAHLCTS